MTRRGTTNRCAGDDLIPVGPLRDAFLASGMTKSEVCHALGWFAGGRPDTSRLAKTLGLRSDLKSSGKAYTMTRIGYPHAVEIVHALGIDPVDVGV